jgi:glycosyltransferase involved in cell wall biosynthesis
VTRQAKSLPPSPDFAPVRMDEVEIGGPLPDLESGATHSSVPFAASLCLVRLHGRPLGLVEVALPEGGLGADALAAEINAALGDELSAHLGEDGLPAADLSGAGIVAPDTPACIATREELLADAPFLSVVICTRNRPDSVRLTLRSILACAYPKDRWEAIVVDNAAEADSSIPAAAAEAGAKVEVRVVHEPVPGLSNARNCGLRNARGELIVFADDDVEVNAEWLAVLAAPFRADPRVGATSGMTLPGSLETPVERWTEGFGGRSRPLLVRRFDLSNPPPDNPLFPFTVGELGAGRNMAFRRELLESLGGFDPALGPGTIAHDGDDIEALLRVLLAGHVIVHDPAAIVWHAHPDDYGELEDRVWGYGVGLTACLTKAVIDRPSLLLGLLRRLPRGLAFAFSSSSGKNVGRQRDFPRSLVRRELLGMAYGPIAYLRSRREARRTRGAGSAGGTPGSGGPGPLRLLIVTDEYRPVIGGAARSAELLSRRMAELGHTVAIATAWQPEAPARELDGKVEVHRVRDTTSRFPWLSEDPQRHHAPPFPDLEAAWRLRRLIAEFKPDLVHGYGWLAHSAAAAMLGKRIPFLLSARDYGHVCANFTLVRKGQLCSGPAPAKCVSCARDTYGAAKGSVAVGSVFGAKPLLRRKVTALHGVSRFISDFMERELHMAGALSATVPNFHEEEESSAPDQETLDLLPSEPFILFVGHLRGYKGIHELLSAYKGLDAPPPLVLVGTKGPDTPSRFPSGVTVLTYVPHATVMAMWDRALFGVFPSIAPEALGNVVHEAMSKGRATIGTRPGGHEDMIVEGETGLLIPGGDVPDLAAAMSRLIEDGPFRERLGGKAKERAALFTPATVVPQLEHLYYDTIRHFEQTHP